MKDDLRAERVTSSTAYRLPDIEALTQTGRCGEALAAARALLAKEPTHRDALYWTAVNLRRLHRTAEAEQALTALERAHPGYSRTFEERGHRHFAQGDAARARMYFERAVAVNPALLSSWERLESLLRAAGESGEAAVASQHVARLNGLPPAIVEAGRLFSDGDHAAAEKLLELFVETDGRHVEALRLLGRLSQRRGALAREERHFREVVERSPGYAAARLDLVRILIERQRYPLAMEAADAALRGAPTDPEARFLRATILAGLGRHEEAVPVFRELVGERPRDNAARIVLGHSLKALGRADEAVDMYRAATRGANHVGDAYWSLANFKTYRFDDAEVARMREIEARPPRSPLDRAQLCFALAKSSEDRQSFDEAWTFYERGNALARSLRSYRPEAIEDNARRLIEVCAPDLFSARSGAGVASREPIFIVGLPRSGSTMIEQILASHSQIDGTQELYDVPRIVAELNESGPRYPEALSALDPAIFERLGRRYLDETRPYRRDRPRFLDKMPNNFWHVGLIQLMLPQAAIIDVRRHPMAACVSNFKQFYAKGQNFCYAVEDIARYYRTYLGVMRHWNATLPGRVLAIRYEDVIDDLEGSVRRILSYCGLELEPACLEFHLNRRVVNTPSSEQVRRPLYRDGLSSWRRFEPWLEPLSAALEDALHRWDEDIPHGGAGL